MKKNFFLAIATFLLLAFSACDDSTSTSAINEESSSSNQKDVIESSSAKSEDVIESSSAKSEDAISSICGTLLKCKETETLSNENMCSHILRCNPSTWNFKYSYQQSEYEIIMTEYRYELDTTSGDVHKYYTQMENFNGNTSTKYKNDLVVGKSLATLQSDDIACTAISHDFFENVKYQCNQALEMAQRYNNFKWGDEASLEGL